MDVAVISVTLHADPLIVRRYNRFFFEDDPLLSHPDRTLGYSHISTSTVFLTMLLAVSIFNKIVAQS